VVRSPPGRVGRALRAAALRGERGSAGADMDGDGAHSIQFRKRRKGVFGVYAPVPLAAFEEPDGVRAKSAAMIADSDSG